MAPLLPELLPTMLPDRTMSSRVKRKIQTGAVIP